MQRRQSSVVKSNQEIEAQMTAEDAGYEAIQEALDQREADHDAVLGKYVKTPPSTVYKLT